MIVHNIDPYTIPIFRRNTKMYLNWQRTTANKRNNSPIDPACSLIIHKSQGGTFSEMIYYYEVPISAIGLHSIDSSYLD